jgi:hypothetical protein
MSCSKSSTAFLPHLIAFSSSFLSADNRHFLIVLLLGQGHRFLQMNIYDYNV